MAKAKKKTKQKNSSKGKKSQAKAGKKAAKKAGKTAKVKGKSALKSQAAAPRSKVKKAAGKGKAKTKAKVKAKTKAKVKAKTKAKVKAKTKAKAKVKTTARAADKSKKLSKDLVIKARGTTLELVAAAPAKKTKRSKAKDEAPAHADAKAEPWHEADADSTGKKGRAKKAPKSAGDEGAPADPLKKRRSALDVIRSMIPGLEDTPDEDGQGAEAAPKAKKAKKPRKARSAEAADDQAAADQASGSDHEAADGNAAEPSARPEVGDEAPDFTLTTDTGEVALSDFHGKQHVLLYFYPKDDTSGCTKQACSFQNNLSQYHDLDVAVIGVSPDDAKSHAKFRAKYDLEFTLAVDSGAEVAKRYGVWVPKSMYGRNYMGIERTTFLIKKDGTIAAVWPKVKVEGHSDEVLEALRAL